MIEVPHHDVLPETTGGLQKGQGGSEDYGKIRARKVVVIFRPVVQISRMTRMGSGDLVSGLTW